MKITTHSPEKTKKLAQKLIQDFLEAEQNRPNALVVSLEGDLGAGKTTFSQGIAQALGISQWIKSPTFVLMREYRLSNPTSQEPNIKYLYHLDCYRLKEAKALLEIGLKEILANRQNIVLIEWGEKLKELLPDNAIKIQFKHLGKNEREIKIR